MAGSPKKVIIRTITDDVHVGYLPVSGIVGGGELSPAVAFLDLEGRIISIALASVRWIAYVREFNRGKLDDPEGLSRRTFLARPRSEGLWLRLTMVGDELMEGLAPLDLALIDALLQYRGIFLTPPDIRSNTQRLFVPRTAFTSCQAVAVISRPTRMKVVEADRRSRQDTLFPDPRRR
jgi:hypothetical protein